MWLLVDQALLDNAEEKLLDHAPYSIPVSLTENTDLEMQWRESPLLVEMDQHNHQTLIDYYRDTLAPQHQAIILITDPSVNEYKLVEHLYHLLIVNLLNGRAWFRFWEPRKLRGFLEALDTDNFIHFMGMVETYVWFEPEPLDANFYYCTIDHPQPSPIKLASFTLSDNEYELLNIFEAWHFKRVLFDQYKDRLASLRADFSTEENFDWLYETLETIHYETEDGFFDLFELLLTYPREQLNTPQVRSILFDTTYEEYVRVHLANHYLEAQQRKIK